MDDVADLTFEVRQRLSSIAVHCEEGATGELSEDEARAHFEAIDDLVLELGALMARLETSDIVTEELQTMSDITVGQPAEMSDSPTIGIALPDLELVDHLIAELESEDHPIKRLYPATLADGLPSDLDIGRLVADPLDAPRSEPPPLLVSLVSPDDETSPLVGVSGVVAPSVEGNILEEVFSVFEVLEGTNPSVGLITDESGDATTQRPLVETLDRLGIEYRPLDPASPAVEAVACVCCWDVHAKAETIARCRERVDGHRRPVFLVGEPPDGTSWQPTIGGRSFLNIAPTAPGLAGELLLALEHHDA